MARRLVKVDWEEPLFARNKARSPEVKTSPTLATKVIDALKVGAPNLSNAAGMTRSSRKMDSAYVGDVSTPDVVIVVDRTTAGVDVPQVGIADSSNLVPKESFDRGLMRDKSPLPDMGDKFIPQVQLHQNELRCTNITFPKELAKHLQIILKLIQDHHFLSKINKWVFGHQTADYLGHIITTYAFLTLSDFKKLSFTEKFTSKLRGHASKTDAAFGEELRLIRSDKYKNLQKIESQMHRNVQELQMNSQADEFSSLVKLPGCFADSDEHALSTSSMEARSSSLFSQPQRKSSRLLSKRRRPDKNLNLLDWEFEEVQDVVFLDDEDFQGHTEDGSSDEWNEVRLFYPSRNVPESVALSRSDMECLRPEQYLSSPIMNFYIQYLQNTKTTTIRTLGECHIFNTFFYGKLEKALTQKGDRFQYFSKLRRWWKGVNIFSKAYVILPIHGSSHWSLVIICNPGNEDDLYLLILHLDSLGLHLSQQIFRIVSNFLKEEWNYSNQSLTADPPYQKYLPFRIEKKKVMVPQQKNKYDCGLFVLYFIERFLEEAPQRLRKHDLSMFHAKWFKPAEASGLRERIQDLLNKEFQRAQE